MDEERTTVCRIVLLLLVAWVVMMVFLPTKSYFSSGEFTPDMSPDDATKVYESVSDRIWKEMNSLSEEAQKTGDVKKSADVSKDGHKALSDLSNKYIDFIHSKAV